MEGDTLSPALTHPILAALVGQAWIPGTESSRSAIAPALASRLLPMLAPYLAGGTDLTAAYERRAEEAEEVANQALEREHAIFLATGADKWGMGNTTALQAVETLVANCAGYQKRAEELVAEAQRAETRAAEYRQERNDARRNRDDIGAELDALEIASRKRIAELERDREGWKSTVAELTREKLAAECDRDRLTLAVEERDRELAGLRALKDRRAEVVVPSQARGGAFGAVPVLVTDRDVKPGNVTPVVVSDSEDTFADLMAMRRADRLVPLTAERLAEAMDRACMVGNLDSDAHKMMLHLTSTGVPAVPEDRGGADDPALRSPREARGPACERCGDPIGSLGEPIAGTVFGEGPACFPCLLWSLGVHAARKLTTTGGDR